MDRPQIMHRIYPTIYLAFLLLLALVNSSSAQSRAQPNDDIVVLVSFDGFRHDYLDRGVTPNFMRLAAAGARADALIPIFPSKTFPNHYSIVTGMYGEHHGIVGNDFFDPAWGAYSAADHSDPNAGRWFGGEPIWLTAERQGVRSASFFWVGSDTKINGALPSLWKKYEEHVSYNARVDTALAWLSLPANQRPRLLLLYFELMDDAGHEFGPVSPQVDSALAKADSILGRLMTGLSRVGNRATLIVVSDHGMSEVSPERRVPMDSLADLTGVRVVVTGPYSTLYFQGDTVRRNDVAAKLKALPHARVYKRDEIPARYHWRDNARIPDVLIVADEGWMVGPRRAMERVRHGGQHGYDPEVKVMQGIFIAAGPRIRAGQRIPAFENVHIHPFIAQLLDIASAPHIDGDAAVLAPLLKW